MEPRHYVHVGVYLGYDTIQYTTPYTISVHLKANCSSHAA